MNFQGGGRSPLLGGVMSPVMPIFKLVQEIMFVDVCEIS